MSSQWWGYICIHADRIPERLSNRHPLFLDWAWCIASEEPGEREYFLPFAARPEEEQVAAFHAAKETREIDDYEIVSLIE